MKSKTHESKAHIRDRETLSLSGPDFLALLQAVLKTGASLRFRAKGTSMSPLIKDGDIVTVAALREEQLSLGQVVAALHPETSVLILHRIVRRKRNAYLLKGDNVSQADGQVSRSGILGRVTAVERTKKRAFAGLGPERSILALLSRGGFLAFFLAFARSLSGRTLKKVP